MKALMLSALFVCSFVFAADQGLPFLDQVTELIKDLGNGSWMVVITMVVEAVLRLFPTDKPKSVILMIGWVCKQLSGLFEAVANLLNKVIPQNLK